MTPMTAQALFLNAFPYQKDLLSLPVVDLDQASAFYARGFGMIEVERRSEPHPAVILERDGVRIGFAINGGDASQDGAAILVSDIERARAELTANGLQPGEGRIDERDGKRFSVFFIVAPDGLCYYVHQELSAPTS